VTTEPALSPDCRVFTPESLATHWGEPWTAASIRELCRTGRIPARKVGPRKWMIPASGLAAWLAASNAQAPVLPAKVFADEVFGTREPRRVVVRRS